MLIMIHVGLAASGQSTLISLLSSQPRLLENLRYVDQLRDAGGKQCSNLRFPGPPCWVTTN